jgi:hypothetical protein
MKENDIQTIFSKVCTVPSVFELKLCKSNALPYDALKPHQEVALLKATNGEGLFHKINDQPWGITSKFRFTKPKPFDCFYLKFSLAYIVGMFYKPRQPKTFLLIDIKKFISARDTDFRKSLTREKAEEISE